MSNTVYDSSEIADTVTELLTEANNSNNAVFRATAYGMTRGMIAGFIVTGMVAGYLTFKAMTGVAEEPDTPLYIISGMNSVMTGVGTGTFGAFAGTLVGAAIGAAKGSLDYVVELIRI